jgi:hypothetical protein
MTAATPGQPEPGTPDQAAIAAHAAHRDDITDWGRALRSWRVLGPEQRDKWRAHAAAKPGCTVCAQAASEREEAGQ